jgi:DNA-3-methyladenine glycosylase II
MMATARKAPAKRAASGSIAAPASKVVRRAQVKTSKVSTPEAKLANGADRDGERKTVSKKRAVNGVAHDGVAKTNGLVRARKTVRATAPSGAAKVSLKKVTGKVGDDSNGVLDVKADESDISAGATQALVRAPHNDGEIVRKSRAITAEKTVPVQTPGLTAEAARPEYWDKACADLVKRDRILKKLIPKFGPVHLINRDDPFTTLSGSVWRARARRSRRSSSSRWGRRSCSRAGYRSASPNISSTLRSILFRARCTWIAGHQWKMKP